MAAIRETMRTLLDAHEPYPALVVDRAWNLVESNRSLRALLVGVDPALDDERAFVKPEHIERATFTGVEGDLRERARSLGEAGYDQLVIQLIHGQEHAIEDWARVFELG